MKFKMMVATLVAGMAICSSNSYGHDLLNRLLCRSGCGGGVSTCCDTPVVAHTTADSGAVDFDCCGTARFGCARFGNFFNRCGCGEFRCGGLRCGGGLLSGSSGCAPVDCQGACESTCNDFCGGGLLGGLFAGRGCGCDDGCGGLGGRLGCGCGLGGRLGCGGGLGCGDGHGCGDGGGLGCGGGLRGRCGG